MGAMLIAMKKNNLPGESIRRAEGRVRLQRLAEEGLKQRTPQDAALDRLRQYLLMWANRQKFHGQQQGYPGSSPFAPELSNATTASEYFDRADNWAMVVMDTSMDDLVKRTDGWLMRAALRVRYLSEGISKEAGTSVRVLRHGRLAHLSLIEADALADRGELELIPIARGRGLPL